MAKQTISPASRLATARTRLEDLESALQEVETRRAKADAELAAAYRSENAATVQRLRAARDTLYGQEAGLAQDIAQARDAVQEAEEANTVHALEVEAERLTAAYGALAPEVEQWLAAGAALAAKNTELYRAFGVWEQHVFRHQCRHERDGVWPKPVATCVREDALRMPANLVSGILDKAAAMHTEVERFRAWLGKCPTVRQREWEQREEWRKNEPRMISFSERMDLDSRPPQKEAWVPFGPSGTMRTA
jgi:hypothetical protein